MRIGTLAERTSKTVRALHLYEEIGLLVPVERSKGGFRLYDDDAVVRVRWIAKLQDMGFSLGRIQEILRAWEASHSAPSAMRRVQELYLEKLEETRAQRKRLEDLERELRSSLEYLDTCDRCDPNRLIDACPVCDQHACDATAPELVAGFHAH
jgi:DNA-binding transcriptional MerR regulator